MKPDVWFPFYVGKFLQDTGHLSQGERGAYLSFMLYYYGRGVPIPHAKRYAIAYANEMQEQCNADAILGEFFIREGDFWKHGMIERELLKRDELSKKRRAAAEKRWEDDPKPPDASAYANAMQMDTQLHSQLHKQEEKKVSIDLGAKRKKKCVGIYGLEEMMRREDWEVRFGGWVNMSRIGKDWDEAKAEQVGKDFIYHNVHGGGKDNKFNTMDDVLDWFNGFCNQKHRREKQ